MIGLALSGGGERAVAWEVGVLAGLADGGVDLRRATAIVGTSAGALVAARLAAGVDPRDDAARIGVAVRGGAASRDAGAGFRDRAAQAGASARRRPVEPAFDGAAAFAALGRAWESAGSSTPERRRAFGQLALRHPGDGDDAHVARVAGQLPRGSWPPALRVVAIEAQRGERVVFDADSGVPAARAIAASRAIPVLRPPVRVGGRLCIDGALGSATNADLLADLPASRVVIVTPLPSEAPAGPERLWLDALHEEVDALERIGHDVVVVQASAADREAMGPDPLSGATAVPAAAAGLARGRALAAQIRPRRAA
jgi:NTE family protein